MGPPLPSFMGIYWPWLQQREATQLALPSEFISDIIDATVTYSNVEEWDLQRGADGRIERVIIHRTVTEKK